MDGDDTDLLHTFTRGIPRAASQRDDARRVRIGTAPKGVPIGTIGTCRVAPHPAHRLALRKAEPMRWLDDGPGADVAGRAGGPARHASAHAGFRSHAPLVRPDAGTPSMARGVVDVDGRVRPESESRAHRDPTRRIAIAPAADDPVRGRSAACLKRGRPGSEVESRVAAPPCTALLDVPRADRRACPLRDPGRDGPRARRPIDPLHPGACAL